jgi:hypothetical protein
MTDETEKFELNKDGLLVKMEKARQKRLEPFLKNIKLSKPNPNHKNYGKPIKIKKGNPYLKPK